MSRNKEPSNEHRQRETIGRFAERNGDNLMGLDTSHDCWHGAYSAFTRWREALAVAANWPRGEVDFGYGTPRESYLLPWGDLTVANLQGEWDRVLGDDPLVYLLAHSDCDGVIHPEQGRHLAKRLRELAPLVDEDKSGGHLWSMRGCTEQFADGLERAADLDEDVDFH